MASEAKDVLVDDSVAVDLDALSADERAIIEAGLDDLDHGRWFDHATIKADIAAMRREVEAEQLARRTETDRR